MVHDVPGAKPASHESLAFTSSLPLAAKACFHAAPWDGRPQNQLLWDNIRCARFRMRTRTMRFGSTAKVLAKCMLKYYRISEWTRGAYQERLPSSSMAKGSCHAELCSRKHCGLLPLESDSSMADKSCAVCKAGGFLPEPPVRSATGPPQPPFPLPSSRNAFSQSLGPVCFCFHAASSRQFSHTNHNGQSACIHADCLPWLC